MSAANYMGAELVQAFAEAPFDHERDLRPDSLALVERIMALTDAELANVRGEACPQCKSRDCLAPRCEIGDCDRHSHTLVEVRPGATRLACSKCAAVRNCASCDAALPRWQMVRELGETFCPSCAHREPEEF